MVTAEAAVVLPLLVLVAGALSGVLVTLGTQMGCADAARQAARMAARGEPEQRVQAVAAQTSPASATLRLSRAGDVVTAEVSAPVPGMSGLLALAPVSVSARASAAQEPGT